MGAGVCPDALRGESLSRAVLAPPEGTGTPGLTRGPSFSGPGALLSPAPVPRPAPMSWGSSHQRPGVEEAPETTFAEWSLGCRVKGRAKGRTTGVTRAPDPCPSPAVSRIHPTQRRPCTWGSRGQPLHRGGGGTALRCLARS